MFSDAFSGCLPSFLIVFFLCQELNEPKPNLSSGEEKNVYVY